MRSAAGKPLTPREQKDMAKANVWIMDVDADGGTLPAEIGRLNNLRRRLTPDEKRVILKWFESTAPGNY